VAGEGVAGLAGARVPDPQRVVVAGGGQPGVLAAASDEDDGVTFADDIR